MSDFSALLPLVLPAAGAVTVVGTAWLTIRKIQRDAAKSKKEQAAEILQEAKEDLALVKTKLEAQIAAVKSDLKNLEANVGKDLEHMKETYNGEIQNLGQKIEALRSDVKEYHSQMVALLTKMIDKG